MPHNCATRSSLVIFAYNESTLESMSEGVFGASHADRPKAMLINAAYFVMGFINALMCFGFYNVLSKFTRNNSDKQKKGKNCSETNNNLLILNQLIVPKRAFLKKIIST